MIELLNRIAADWAEYFWMVNWQNGLFLGVVLPVMHHYRQRRPHFVRAVGLLTLVKLLLPPVFSPPFWTYQSVSPVLYELAAISPARLPVAPPATSLSIAAWAFLGWIIAGGFVLALVVRRYRQLVHIAAGAIPFAAAEAQLELPRHCRVFRSSATHSPFVVGFRQHRIVFPAEADRWNAEAIRTALAHELAHIRLWDHWVNLLQLLVQAVFWVNPLVWFFNRRLNAAREIVCDEHAAVTLRQSPAAYARNLLDLAARLVLPRVLWVSPLFFASSENHLKNRIMYQIENKGDAMKKWTRMHVSIFAALALLLLPLSCNYSEPSSSSSSDEAPTGMALSKAEEEGVVPFYELTEKPQEIKQVRPKYPEAAKAAGIEGTVVVRVRIGTDGRVEETKMLKSVPELDFAAMEAARQFEFKPGKVNGKPVKVWVSIPFNFRLKEKDAAGGAGQ